MSITTTPMLAIHMERTNETIKQANKSLQNVKVKCRQNFSERSIEVNVKRTGFSSKPFRFRSEEKKSLQGNADMQVGALYGHPENHIAQKEHSWILERNVDVCCDTVCVLN
jgi:hypothetical protein